jgi:hypothetical protein
MAPHGKTPSLIGGGAGASKIVKPAGTRHCKRCGKSIAVGAQCIEVAVPGTMGHKTYCSTCFKQIISQSKKDLAEIEAQAHAIP